MSSDQAPPGHHLIPHEALKLIKCLAEFGFLQPDDRVPCFPAGNCAPFLRPLDVSCCMAPKAGHKATLCSFPGPFRQV